MTALQTQLREVLEELDRAVANLSTAQPKPNLMALFERIDGLAKALPPGTDPSLMHYLQKRSYQKALLYLQGRDNENTTGKCGHV